MNTIEPSPDPHYDWIISGTPGDDYLPGDPYGPSRNIIKGLEGNDTLMGGAMYDSLEGGPGADVIDGGSDSDYSSYKNSPEGVDVHLRPGEAASHGGDAEGDTLINIENLSGSQFGDVLVGHDGSNALYGNGGGDTLIGGGGGDWLSGGNDNDYLDGGSGGDFIFGDEGVDLLSYWASTAGVNVNLLTGQGSGGDAAGDWINGVENVDGTAYDDYFQGNDQANTFHGSQGSDMLNGGDGAAYDTLYGDEGNDTLYAAYLDYYSDGGSYQEGGTGVDQLTGGGGADTFFFATGDSGDIFAEQADKIFYFDGSEGDRILLQGSYDYAGNTSEPADGQYSIWQKDGGYVVTWNAVGDDGFHDVSVPNGDPSGDILFVV
jgi:Ca2+-binding RTX toxin-like protein